MKLLKRIQRLFKCAMLLGTTASGIYAIDMIAKMTERGDFLKILTTSNFLTTPLKLNLAGIATLLFNTIAGLLDHLWFWINTSLHSPLWLLHIPHNLTASKFWSEHLTIDFGTTPLQLFLGFDKPHDAESLRRYFQFANTLNIELGIFAAFFCGALMFGLCGYLMNTDLAGAYERSLAERGLRKIERIETALSNLESRL